MGLELGGKGLAIPKVLEFDFDVIDLSRMQAEDYVKMPNPAALAIAARMKSDRQRRIRLTTDFFLTLAAIPLTRREQELVAGFFSAYQPLSAGQDLKLQRELGKVRSHMARQKEMQLTNPFIELGKKEGLQQGLRRGLQEGIVRGRQQGEAELVLRLLARRLGSLSASQEKAIRKLPLRKIEALGEALLEMASRDDLARCLRRVTKDG